MMKSLKSILLLAGVATVLFGDVLRAEAQVPTLPPNGGFLLGSPSCTTLNAQGLATSSFRAGDELIMRGGAFPANALILVSFQQAPLVVELGRFKAGPNGDVTTEPTLLRLPTEAVGGAAIIRASSDTASANCEIFLVSAPAAADSRPVATPVVEEGDPWFDTGPAFIVWSTLLALGGGYLTYITYRRWQARRLEEAMSHLRRNGRNGHREHVERRRRRMSGPPRLDALSLPPQPAPAPRPQGDSYESPPVLPLGWDAGREPTPVRGPDTYE